MLVTFVLCKIMKKKCELQHYSGVLGGCGWWVPFLIIEMTGSCKESCDPYHMTHGHSGDLVDILHSAVSNQQLVIRNLMVSAGYGRNICGWRHAVIN